MQTLDCYWIILLVHYGGGFRVDSLNSKEQTQVNRENVP